MTQRNKRRDHRSRPNANLVTLFWNDVGETFFSCLCVHSLSTDGPQLFHTSTRVVESRALGAGIWGCVAVTRPLGAGTVAIDGAGSHHYAGTGMRLTTFAAALVLAVGASAGAQTAPSPHFRVFLKDGSTLVSFGEWARVDNFVVFSMPLTASGDSPDLHLVSLPVERVDLARSESYADQVRAARYAATQGEADFARLSQDVANALNQVALIADPMERLKAAERARQALRDWPGAHHGYRAADVQEILGVLDGVIAGLRASSGQGDSPGRFDLTLSASTEPPREALLASPDQAEIVQHLMTASTLVTSPAEKTSLLQSVLAVLDRAVDELVRRTTRLTEVHVLPAIEGAPPAAAAPITGQPAGRSPQGL